MSPVSWFPVISKEMKKPLISTVLRDTPAAPEFFGTEATDSAICAGPVVV